MPAGWGRRGRHACRPDPLGTVEAAAGRRGGTVSAGFTAVFTAEVMSVLGLSDLLALNEALLQRVGGVVTIVMGLAFVGLVPLLQRQARVQLTPRGGLPARRCSGRCSGWAGPPVWGPP